MKKKLWFMSYSWMNSQGSLRFETEITYTHPIVLAGEWREKYPQEQMRLIAYQEVTSEELQDPKVQEVVDFVFESNMGEL